MRKIKLVLLCLALFLLAGCGSRQDSETKEYTIYYVDKDENKVSGTGLEVDKTETKEVLQVLFRALKEQPEDTSYRSAIPESVELLSFSFSEHQLILNFDAAYLSLSRSGEVLSRAAIVRTLCQVKDVDSVAFRVDGEPLTNQNGTPIGYMTAEQFIDNAGDEISAYEKTTLTLYFANADGDRLVEQEMECVYNSNISMDKLVVEQLIEGPEEGQETAYAAISRTTQIVSVTTKDGVCYVNLDDGFLTRQGNVTPEVAVYSIVNSLAELSGVNKVQISVNGSSDLVYMETLSLSQMFERNLEIIDNAQ